MPVNATRAETEAAAEFLKGLSNPNRLMIAARLSRGEASVGDLESELGIRQPTLSQQLAGLREAGLVATRRDAKQVFYRLADEKAARIVGVLSHVYGLAADPQPRNRRPAGTAAPEPGHGASRFARILPFPDAGGRA
ncbi:transcriptional regulator [Hansschlegelia zhihuaiae]|uniref:Transcriptional regulator n=1 Tax=Hansschlegelia zhihuaiae TaxID=405005 RepID=A0A4Q0MQR9_9HYPH|nr:metalloregulator ArsR/SmtB family transcription factor [Hansschlegelia zhihuaiae]RXF75569.1 transcriptional regulator [Hansschlegelia zhihuaiae]